MLNQISDSAGRTPVGRVKINGQELASWIEWEFDNNSHYQADTFRVIFAAGGLPADRNAAWLTNQADLTVEILAGFDSAKLQSFIVGRVDDVEYDPARNIIELSGRDYTSQFIDAKTTEQFPNKSIAWIVTTLATRHGMTANVASLPTLAGKFYQIDRVRLTDEHTEWDLLTYLAHETQCNVWVSGQTLNFQPLPDPAKSDAYVIQWAPPSATSQSPQANVIDIKFARNLTLAKDVKVIVRSWNMKQAKGFAVTATATKTKNPILRNSRLPYGQPQLYTYTIPNLSKQDALVKAQALLAEISKHELRFEAHLPADNVLTAQVLVRVQGTGTPFDQMYYPESVIREMSVDEGYRMHLRAKNHSPESIVVA